jgi:hypothetical protein
MQNWSLQDAARRNQYETPLPESTHIVAFPPSLSPVACKPMLFDLALVACEYPSLEKRKEQTKAGGLFSFFKRG